MTAPFPTFREFFTALTGYTPYQWQERFADALRHDVPVDHIPVPTGLGKTQVITAWAWAFAAQAHDLTAGTRERRTLATRLHYLVDRRVIIDEATDAAEALVARLHTETDGPVAVVAAALADTARLDSDGHPVLVDVIKMRGGLPERVENTRTPVTPAIILGTIDLFGSRLLFRGYGTSTGSRPIEAALTGIDSLVILDEAHIADQFAHTLRVLDQVNARETAPVPLRRVILMSATPGSQPGTRPLVFDRAAETAANPALGAALLNRDDVTVTVTSIPGEKVADSAVIASLVNAAETVAPAPGQAVVVFTNTIAVARGVSTALTAASRAAEKDGAANPARVLLLHGGIPAPVRARVLAAVMPFKTRAQARSTARPTYVVATQTLEVGADLDFDHAVMQASALNSFLQRAGRVNRVGARTGASIHVVCTPQTADLVYGHAASKTGEYLSSTPTMADVHAGLVTADMPTLLGTTTPALTVDQVTVYDLLHTQGLIGEPDIAPLLRRPSYEPRVFVTWRNTLSGLVDQHGHALPGTWETYVQTNPPREWEMWSVRIVDLCDARGPMAAKAGKATQYVQIDPDADPRDLQPQVLTGVPNKLTLQARTVFVLPGTAPSMDSAGYTHSGIDLSAFASRREGPSAILTPNGTTTGTSVRASKWTDLTAGLEQDDTSTVTAALQAAADAATQHATKLASAPAPTDHTTAITHELTVEVAQRNAARLTELANGKVRTTMHTDPETGDITHVTVTSDTRTESVDTGPGATLNDHDRDVAEVAARWATQLGLPEHLVTTIRTAGARHDWGKLLSQFQRQLSFRLTDGHLRPSAATTPLAKSGLPSWAWPYTARIAGVPTGFRHEALSVAISDQVPAPEGTDQALLRHLIGTHHGDGRGTFSVATPIPADRYVTNEFDVTTANPVQDPADPAWVTWAEQFHDLNVQHGPYTLAFLETILRLADWHASAQGDDPR